MSGADSQPSLLHRPPLGRSNQPASPLASQVRRRLGVKGNQIWAANDVHVEASKTHDEPLLPYSKFLDKYLLGQMKDKVQKRYCSRTPPPTCDTITPGAAGSCLRTE